jgi:outer membrane receptor protein involved in Fe transport
MSADLIKSVDVVKGSTADMTEGSLGGGIIIKTRTGLDFKKPFAVGARGRLPGLAEQEMVAGRQPDPGRQIPGRPPGRAAQRIPSTLANEGPFARRWPPAPTRAMPA